MAAELALDDLARMAAEPVAVLRDWQARGLLPSEHLSLRDVEVARLIRALERRGLPAEVIDVALHEHADLVRSFVERLTPADATVTGWETAAADVGIPSEVIERIIAAGGLEDARFAPTPEDLRTLASIRTVLDSGLPEDVLLQLVRVYADALERVADAEIRLFHLHVHQALRGSGLTGNALLEATNVLSRELEALVEPTVAYFHRKAWTRAMRRDFVVHILEEIGAETPEADEGRMWRAVLFVDLSSFTPLAHVMGDITAAQILDRFSRHVREVARAWGGSVVKQIGDGFLVVFLETSSAVAAALEINRRLDEEPQFPAMHAGIHYGPVLYREGDYVGTTVNIAARVVSEAGRNQVVLTTEARRDAGTQADASFTPIGTREVKGLEDAIELFRADSADHRPSRRLVDPMCGMQLADEEVAARMTVSGHEYVFCSAGCLTAFATRSASAAMATP